MKPDPDLKHWKPYRHLFTRLEIPAKTLILKEGQIAKHTYFLESGCMRIWFNHSDKDITLNFFFGGEGVSSIESFRTGKPSAYSLESLATCVIHKISKKDFRFMVNDSPEIKKKIEEVSFQTLFLYQQLFLSRIKNSPEERYRELIKLRPDILRQIPQHYIASYLGITAVSLSRIRNRR